MKKLLTLSLLALVVLLFNACDAGASGFIADRQINVVSREAGSGTRGAFTELMGILVIGDGTVTDMTSPNADVGNGTNMVIMSVVNNSYAIGYISLGSLNGNVRAVSVDGIAPTVANILNGSYPIFRPFYIAYQDGVSPARDDFMNFMLSAEGQAVVAAGYVPVDSNLPPFNPADVSGTVVVVGSTAVAPVMEALMEAYNERNPNVNIEIQIQGSSAGINAAISGTADIGMSSRALSEAERAQVNYAPIAYDGLVVIVNNQNPIENLTSEEVRQIFVGELTRWDEVID